MKGFEKEFTTSKFDFLTINDFEVFQYLLALYLIYQFLISAIKFFANFSTGKFRTSNGVSLVHNVVCSKIDFEMSKWMI